MKRIRSGFLTGLILHFAVGPVFFYIIGLAIQKSLLNAMCGVIAVVLADSIFILIAISGATRTLENKKVKIIFGTISSLVLIIFGYTILNSNTIISSSHASHNIGLLKSFISTFLLTISNPLSIIFFTGLFTTKAIENNYTKRELYFFGAGTLLSTILFMATTAIIFSTFKSQIPVLVLDITKKVIGCVIFGYGIATLFKTIKNQLNKYI